MNECLDDSGKITAEKCKKFIETDAEEKKKDLAEFGFASMLWKEKLKRNSMMRMKLKIPERRRIRRR